MKWNIDKQFSFCYGHRVWNQKLDKIFAESNCCVCRHLHGHQGEVKIHLEAKQLYNGMVTDFKHLNWFKTWLDTFFDHKIIFDLNDPLLIDEFSYLIKLIDLNGSKIKINDKELTHFQTLLYQPEKTIGINKRVNDNGLENFYVFNMNYVNKLLEISEISDELKHAIIEKYEGIVIVDFVPTSENICSFFFKVIEDRMKDLSDILTQRVYVKGVEYWETPKSHCEFTK